ncbi:MAG: AAA-like domain-containing protein [Gammaproteobacteria bacterium]
MARVFISYQHVYPDEGIARAVEHVLTKARHTVFLDTEIDLASAWGATIEALIRSAQFFIVLLSAESIRSDMIRREVNVAYERSRQGQLRILPIHVAFEGALPHDLAGYLVQLQYASWHDGEPVDSIASRLLEVIEGAAELNHAGAEGEDKGVQIRALYDVTEAKGAPMPVVDPRVIALGPESGAIRLDSPFYVLRETDAELEDQLKRPGDTTIIKGARQMGKSSLLARAGVFARNNGSAVSYIDLQQIDAPRLDSLDGLLRYLGSRMGRDFKATLKAQDYWDDALGPKDNLTDFIEDAILAGAIPSIVLLLDETDRVFGFDYRDDFFATLRFWHNRRATHPLWQRFNLVLAHSTEPALWIQDINQSPFNVGVKLRLRDFTVKEVDHLNTRYQSPLRTDGEIARLHVLVGGQPYLTRQGLYWMASQKASFAEFVKTAIDIAGPFGDHLRRLIWLVQQEPGLKQAAAQVLRDGRCDSETYFQRLSSAGIVIGPSRDEAGLRCFLYERHFARFL